jgi:hypothetical protein
MSLRDALRRAVAQQLHVGHPRECNTQLHGADSATGDATGMQPLLTVPGVSSVCGATAPATGTQLTAASRATGSAADALRRPYALSQADADAAHAVAWNDAQIGRFTHRVVLFIRRCINATDADDLAEGLHLRDLQGDDRIMCIECRHLQGSACGNWRAAGLASAGISRDLAVQLQRCPGSEVSHET